MSLLPIRSGANFAKLETCFMSICYRTRGARLQRAGANFSSRSLESKLQSKLNLPRRCSYVAARDSSRAAVNRAGSAEHIVGWRREILVVKNIEELRPEL